VALSQARILYQNHSGDYPQVILTIPVTCRTQGNITNIKLFAGNKLKNAGDILPFILPCMTIILLQSNHRN
jgi:hypothetical protein